jgi:hypothetical protein
MNAEYGSEDSERPCDTTQALEAYRRLAKTMGGELAEPVDERVLLAGQHYIDEEGVDAFDTFLENYRLNMPTTSDGVPSTSQAAFLILLDYLKIKKEM